MENLKKRVANLLSVKSIVTIIMSGCMAALLLTDAQPSQEVLALFCTSYGAIITYFFTKKEE